MSRSGNSRSSNASGRPGLPSGAAAYLGGSAASIAGVQSSLPMNSAMASPWPGDDGMYDYRRASLYGDDGRRPAMPDTIASLPYGASGPGGVPAFSTSAHLGLGHGHFGHHEFSSQTSAGPTPYDIPGVTPAYEKAAAALGSQVASGASFALNDYEGLANPFEMGATAGLASESHNRPADGSHNRPGNREVTLETLQSLGVNRNAMSDGFSAPQPSQYSTMPSSAFAGFNGDALAGWSGSRPVPSETQAELFSQMREETLNAGRGSRYQPFDPASAQGPSYTGAAAISTGYGAAYGGQVAMDAGSRSSKQQQDAEKFNFPTTGSFVAEPYEGDGVPSYDRGETRGELMGIAADMGRYSSEPIGFQNMDAAPLRGMNSNPAARSAAGVSRNYDSYGSVVGHSPNGYENYPSSASRGAGNAYDGHLGGAMRGAAIAYDPRGAPDYHHGAPDYRGAYSGGPHAGNVPNASIGSPMPGSPMPGSRQTGSVLATSGSFVAAPYAEGAPSLDMLPPPSSMPYAPPPMPLNNLPTSGSFVAAPFADGAPTPDMFGLSSMAPRMPTPSGYPDSYSSLPPAPGGFGMYGAGMGMGGGGANSPFSYGANPFVGFDAEVPGKSLAPSGFGMGPTAGSYASMDGPLKGKECSNSGPPGVRFSDKKNDHPGIEAQPKKGDREGRDANSKQHMSRGSSRERDSRLPRTKRKSERKVCC